MYLRLALLSLASVALALAASVVSADELSVLFTGVAYPVNGPQTPTPFYVSFDLSTLSGQQSYVFGVGPCLQTFDISGVVVTNFVASVGGQNLASSPTTFGGVGGVNPTGDCSSSSIEGGIDIPGTQHPQFIWAFFGTPSPTKAEFATWSDPLASLLRSLDYHPGANEGGISGEWNFVFKSIAIPEPGMLELMTLGLLATTGVSFVRRRRAG